MACEVVGNGGQIPDKSTKGYRESGPYSRSSDRPLLTFFGTIHEKLS